MELTDAELRIATTASRRVERVTKGYLEQPDILSEIYTWLVANYEKVNGWRDHEKGKAILATACYRAGLKAVDRERRQRGGLHHGDLYYYTPGVLRLLLPDVWQYESWLVSTVQSSNSGSSNRPKSPSEGNDRLAMLCDVAFAVRQLHPDDQALLRDVFADGGADVKLIAYAHDMTEVAMEKKVQRTLVRLCDKLGGEPPWWTPGRKAKSNAQAQAETE